MNKMRNLSKFRVSSYFSVSLFVFRFGSFVPCSSFWSMFILVDYPRTHVMVPLAISHSHSHTVYGNYSGGICRRKKSQTINYSVVICLGWPLKWQKLMKWPANKSGTNIYDDDDEIVNGYVVWPTHGGFIYSASTCESYLDWFYASR